MKPLKVDFAPRHRVAPGWWMALSVALIALAASQSLQAWAAMQEARVIRAHIVRVSARLERQRLEQQAAIARALVVPPYAKDAAAFAKLAGFPLNRVLRSLETVQIEGVRVTAIDVDAPEDLVRVELEQASGEILMRYLGELNAGEEKPRWQLVQMRAAATGGTNVGTAQLVSRWSERD